MLDNASPFLVRPPPPQSRNAVAYQRLRQALIAGDIAPGQAFGEDEVATRFRLGRSAVRVALTSLAAAGFVLRNPRQGWRSVPITGALIGDIVTARRRLEPVLVERSFDSGRIDQLLLLARMSSAAIAAGDRKALSTACVADRQILDSLARGAGALVARWLGEAWDHGARVAFLIDPAAPLWPTDREPLLKAIAAKDIEAARREIENDIARFEAFCVRAILSPAGLDTEGSGAPRKRSARRRKNPAVPAATVANRTIER